MKKTNCLRILSLLIAISLIVNICSMSKASSKIKLNRTNVTVYIGDSFTLKLKNSKNNPKWSSSKKSIATVNSNGKITAKKAGVTKIVAKYDKRKYTCKVTVPRQYISKKSITLEIGENKEISIYGVSNNDNIVWSTSNKKIATVSDGIINGVNNGITTISGTTNNGRGNTYKCKVVVYSYKYPAPNPTPIVKPTQTISPTNTPVITPANTPIVTQNPVPTPKDEFLPTAPPIVIPTSTPILPTSMPTNTTNPSSPSSNPSDVKQKLLIEENIRYELELSEIKSKYEADIQSVNAAIYFAKLHDDYYKGTTAQYNAEVKDLTQKIASIEKQIAALSGNNSEEARLRISKLKKELQYYDDILNTLEDQWALRMEIEEYNSILEIINNDYKIAIASAEERHRKALEEIISKNI